MIYALYNFIPPFFGIMYPSVLPRALPFRTFVIELSHCLLQWWCSCRIICFYNNFCSCSAACCRQLASTSFPCLQTVLRYRSGLVGCCLYAQSNLLLNRTL